MVGQIKGKGILSQSFQEFENGIEFNLGIEVCWLVFSFFNSLLH
jgi:hypothetical protein